MQSLASPSTSYALGQPLSRRSRLVPSITSPRVLQTTAASTSTSTSTFVAASPPVSAKAGGKRGVGLFDAMKFNGPAPELINGRLAMLGFVNGAIHEYKYGETLLQQGAELPWWAVALMVVWIYASLVPILRGVKNNEAFGIFSPSAEIVNGRVAMLGITLQAYLEYTAGVPFF